VPIIVLNDKAIVVTHPGGTEWRYRWKTGIKRLPDDGTDVFILIFKSCERFACVKRNDFCVVTQLIVNGDAVYWLQVQCLFYALTLSQSVCIEYLFQWPSTPHVFVFSLFDLTGCGRTLSACHPEEPQAVLSETKEGSLYLLDSTNAGILRFALQKTHAEVMCFLTSRIARLRLSMLGMTALASFSAACQGIQVACLRPLWLLIPAEPRPNQSFRVIRDTRPLIKIFLALAT